MDQRFENIVLENWYGGERIIYASAITDIEKKLDSLDNKKNSTKWFLLDIDSKARILQKWATYLFEKKLILAELNCKETGRSILSLKRDSIPKAIDAIKWFCSEKSLAAIKSTKIESKKSITHIESTPLGIIALVLPWNDPLVTLAWKICPALLTGNRVVLKPSEYATNVIEYAINLLHESGLPSDVVSVITGGGDVGNFLISDDRIDAIAFTGSSSTGKKIIINANQHRIKPVSLECGGKGVFIYAGTGDYSDLNKFTETVAKNIFYNQGQICSAPSIIFCPENLNKKILKMISMHAEKYNPQPPNTQNECGFMNSPHRVDKTRTFIAENVPTECFYGATNDFYAPPPNSKWSMTPTILEKLSLDNPVNYTELFAPVLISHTYSDIETTLNFINNSNYGLANGIWTSNVELKNNFRNNIDSGNIHINSWGDDTNGVPFGGIKNSGFGREKCIDAFKSYSYLKSTFETL